MSATDDENFWEVPEGELGPPFGGCTLGSHERICDDGIWTCAVRRFNIPDAPPEPTPAPEPYRSDPNFGMPA